MLLVTDIRKKFTLDLVNNFQYLSREMASTFNQLVIDLNKKRKERILETCLELG